MMEVACAQVQWLLNHLLATILSQGSDAVGDGEVGDGNGSSRRDSLVKDLCHKNNIEWTVFDLLQLGSRLDGAVAIIGHPVPLIRSCLKSTNTASDELSNNFWSTKLDDENNSNDNISWKDAVLMPHRTAASEILSQINIHQNANPAMGNGGESAVDNYLRDHASKIQERLQQFTLPFLQRKLLQQEQNHTEEQQRQKQCVQFNNNAFEQWDDYCMNFLGVDSDSLPLFPQLDDSMHSVNSLGTQVLSPTDIAIDMYAIQVGKIILDPMKKEFEQMSRRFLQSLCPSVKDHYGQGEIGANRYYGGDILDATLYCKQFTKFLLQASWGKSVNQDNQEPLPTLYQHVSPSSDPSFLLMQFTTCPITRANLLGELQQLEAFLSSRIQELSSNKPTLSARRGGRDIIDAIGLELTQFCIARKCSEVPSDGVSLESLTKFHCATNAIIDQVIGDGTHAKRLRFLADSVGTAVTAEDDGRKSFEATCKKASTLAYQMMLHQDQQEWNCHLVKLCSASINTTKKEILDVECRIKLIGEGLNGNST